MFEILGLSLQEENVYRELVRRRSATPVALQDAVGLSEAEASRALRALERKGFVSWTTGSERRMLAAPPAAAVEALVLRRERELQQARVAAAQLAEEWAHADHDRKADEMVEIIIGEAAMTRRFEALLNMAKDEVLGFTAAPFLVAGETNVNLNVEALERGVRSRTIYERAVLEAPGALDSITRLQAAGEQVRVLPSLPTKMVMADGVQALLPVNLGVPGAEPSSALVHAPLTSALIALFEELWRRAIPLSLDRRVPASSNGEVPSPDDLKLLSLLLSGLTDDASARLLGVSRRTVHRRLLRLMQAAGASTRVQLVWRTAEKGWIPLPEHPPRSEPSG